MFFIFSKVLSFLTDPLIWFFIILITGIYVKKRTLVWIALALGYLLSNRMLIDLVLSAYEYPMQKVESYSYHKVAVLLGGGSSVYSFDTSRAYLNTSGNRLVHAHYLAWAGKVGTLVYSGSSAEVMGPVYAESLKVSSFMKSLLPDSVALLFEYKSRNTYENALFSTPLVQNIAPFDTILLITSAWHMPRAKAVFEKQGYLVEPCPSDSKQQRPTNWSISYFLLPHASALEDWKTLMHEWIGYVVYCTKGYC